MLEAESPSLYLSTLVKNQIPRACGQKRENASKMEKRRHRAREREWEDNQDYRNYERVGGRMRVRTAIREAIDPSRSVVGHLPLVWHGDFEQGDANAAGAPVWTTWTETVTSLPYAPHESRLATIRGIAVCPESVECYAPSTAKGKALPSKLWEPDMNGGQATTPITRSVFHCPSSVPASSLDALELNLEISFVPGFQQLIEVPNPTDVWVSSTTPEEERSQTSSSQVEDLIEEDSKQGTANLKCNLSSSSIHTRKTSGTTPHKASRSSRPGAGALKKAEHAPPSVEVSVFDACQKMKALSCEDGGQIVSEKRQKRLLSNRASAQRSRQRRQERLDTLEVLVVELRVENVALTRKASTATLAAKKSEKENKILRDQLGKLGSLSRSDPTDENDRSTTNYTMPADEKNGGARLCGASFDLARNGSHAAVTEEPPHPDSPLSLKTIRDNDGADVENSKRWNSNNFSSGCFDFSGPIEEGVEAEFCSGEERSSLAPGVPESVHSNDQYACALAHQHSLQDLCPFGREFGDYD